MIFIKAIPKNFLVHTASVRTPVRHNSFGGSEYFAPVILKYIRIDYEVHEPIKAAGAGYNSVGTLIYDVQNSSPKNFDFEVGQEVSFDGQVFTVYSVLPLFHGKKLHHIEAGLKQGSNLNLSLWKKREANF